MRSNRLLTVIAVILASMVLTHTQQSIASTIMYIDSVSAGANKTVSFSLFISNDRPFVGFQLDIVYPVVLTYLDASAHLTSRAKDHLLSARVVSQGVLRLVVYSTSQSTLEGTTGAVLTVEFISGTAPGVYMLQIQNAVVADSIQQNILTNVYPGRLTLVAPHLEIVPKTIDFGSVPLYQRSVRSVSFTNDGNTPLNIKSISTRGYVFSINDSSGFTVPPGSTINREVSFISSKKGRYSDSLNVVSDDPSAFSAEILLNGVGFAVNELRVGSANGRSGHIFHIPISINNMEPFTGFQFRLQLPVVARYVTGSAHLSPRATDHVVAVDTSANTLTVVAYSPSNSLFKDSNGVVLTLDLLVLGQGGGYPLSLLSALISDSTAKNIMSASYPGNIQVVSPSLWLNASIIEFGSVSAKDTARASLVISNSGSDTLVINSFYIDNPSYKALFTVPASIPPGNSRNLPILFHSVVEGTNSGQITIRSNDVQHDPAYISLSANVYFPDVLSVENGFGFKNENGIIKLDLENMKPITGIQYDVQIPSTISVIPDSIRLTSRRRDHIITASVLSPGMLRVIAYSPSLASFSPGMGAIIEMPAKLSDTVGTFQVHLSGVVLSDTTGKNVLTGTNDGYYKILSRKITITGNLASSWNLVSIPVIPDSYALTNLFPYAVSKAFSFDLKYIPADTLRNQYGYWLKFGSPYFMSISGLPIALDSFFVHAGWNLIGSISSSISVDSVAVSPTGNLSSFYFGFKNGYRVADSLRPGMGYWVKVYNPGVLVLRTDMNKIYSSAEKGEMNVSDKLNPFLVPLSVNSSFLDTLNFLIVTDADSFSQKLFFGRSNIDSLTLLKYELPPKPPDGAFDARFVSGRFLELLPEKTDTTDLNVEVQTSRYPLMVSWHIIQRGMRYFIVEKGSSGMNIIEMKGDDKLTIEDSTEKSFTLRCISAVTSLTKDEFRLPIRINLEQNYPNPFNPSTLIRFELPRAEPVDLSVYDVTGRKVETLVKGYCSAGIHEVTFNASGLSSGVYIAKLTAGNKVFIEKIVFLR
ncbi:MAG: choice-of-anchor D domain-containing protein [Candidatus Kryptoniota bacterium]